MEKRLKKTLARTLGCGKASAKLALTVVLFFPALSAFNSKIPQEKRGGAERISNAAEVVDRIRPKELVKINAILRSHRPDISESESWRLSEVIFEESSKRQLDPLLVTALIQVESGFKSAAVSPMGARGMMQIMPDTGKFLAETVAGEYGFQPAAFRPESLDDPVLNLRLGIYYLHDLKRQFQHLNLALTAYNFGPADTQNRLENNLDLSDEFAGLVLDAYRRHKKIRQPAF
ncbi:MAG: lytic transglycosylase domain-containing protein [Candidatus Binatia bacterium]